MDTHLLQITPIPAGSSLYYALLYATPLERDAVAVITHFFIEINHIVSNISENAVAKTKLAWWSKEIAQIYKQYPQHPLSYALAEVIQRYQLPQAEFQRYLQAMIALCDEQAFDNRDDMGARLYLIACISAPPAEKFIDSLSTLLQSIQDLRYVGKNTSSAELPEKRELLIQQSQSAKTAFEASLQELNANERAKQLHLIILSNIYIALLNEIITLPLEALKNKTSLTPLRKLWIAWRTKSNEKRIVKKL